MNTELPPWARSPPKPAMERNSFLVASAEQLKRFLDANRDRIKEAGGMVLIDEDPDYLSIAPDAQLPLADPLPGRDHRRVALGDRGHRERRRAGRAVQPGRDLRRVRRGGARAGRPARRANGCRRPDGRGRHRARGDGRRGHRRRHASPRRATPARPTNGHAARIRRAAAGRRGGRSPAVRPRAHLPGAQPAHRSAADRAVREVAQDLSRSSAT